jgi:Flp pilus assembly protein TadD
MAEVDGAHQRPNATLAELREVPADDPLGGAVKLRMAALEARIGDTQEAVATLDALARAYPTRPEPLSELGDILADKKRYPDAIQAYDHAIGRVKQPDAQDWGLFFARGIALDHNHDWPHAESDFMRGLELSPDNPAILNYVGYSWAVQGKNLDRARQMIQKALDQRPNDGAIADSLGWVMLRQGDTPGAIHWIEKAATLEPEDPTITGHLGDAYWQAGRHAEAQEQWQRALVLHPDPDDQARIEARLRSAATDAPKQP